MANPKVIFEFFDKLKDVLTDLDTYDLITPNTSMPNYHYTENFKA